MSNFNFNTRLVRTPTPHPESKRRLVINNLDFLRGKSLVEFGVYRGGSLSDFGALYDEFGIEKKFYGFDSFIGLPKETADTNNPDYWPEGAFNDTDYNAVRNSLPFVNITPGFFQDSLTTEMANEIKKNEVGIFHIDCDLYTSTIQVLEWIVQNNLLVDGAILIYDDWGGHYYYKVGEYECGEGKAHKEICEKYGLDFEFISCDEIQNGYHEICIFRYKKNN